MTFVICRTNPSTNLFKRHVRKAHIQYRLLRPPSIVHATRPASNRTSARTRVGIDEELAELAISQEGFDQTNRCKEVNRDNRHTREHEGRTLCESERNVRDLEASTLQKAWEELLGIDSRSAANFAGFVHIHKDTPNA